jgi:V/A-type H+/Na+-transporting ATPase subunit K
MNNAATHLKRRIGQSFIGLFSVLAILGTIFVFESYAQGHERSEMVEKTATHATDQANSSKAMWAFIAAAVSFGLGALGAGIAISSVGAAAMGAVAEKPEIAGQALIFVALAEGLVVFGFIMGLLILGKI